MSVASIKNVSASLSVYIKASKEEPVIITEDGQPIAVILPILEEGDLEGLKLASNPEFRRLLDAAEQRIEQTGGIRHDDFWQKVEEM